MLPSKFSPADVAAVEAVGEIDLVDGPIGPRSRVGEGLGNRGHSEDAAALRHESCFADHGAGMEYTDAVDLLRSVDLADQPSARRRARITARGNDDRHRMLVDEPRRVDFIEAARRNGMQELGEIAIDQWHDRFALGVAEADIIFDQPGSLGGKHQSRIKHAAERRSRGGEGARGRKDDFVHRPPLQLGRQHRRRRIGAHSAGIRAGVADVLRSEGFAVFGPSAAAARLEGSKGFTKDLCRANAIPTAGYVRVDRAADAIAALDQFGIPVVIKADGLAAGKGVTVAMSRAEAEAAIDDAGDGPLVIEEFLEGEEASLFALVDGGTALALASAQDHKRVGEGDTGPNTGGMGAYAPAPVLTPELQHRAMEEIVLPTARALAAAGTPFSGVLYAGLMLTSGGPKLIEYNVRFGDPECEAIMPLVDGDFAELLHAVATGRLGEIEPPRLLDKHSMTVIVAARGYPGAPASGGLIGEIEAAEQVEGVSVFHAGTALGEGGLVATGGRVLAVTAVAETFANARARAYRAVDQIDFADGFHRRDIGWRELAREPS